MLNTSLALKLTRVVIIAGAALTAVYSSANPTTKAHACYGCIIPNPQQEMTGVCIETYVGSALCEPLDNAGCLMYGGQCNL